MSPEDDIQSSHRPRRDDMLTERSRALRSGSSFSERRLWHELRDRKLNGLKFRRQFVVGQYICDFACVESRLVIELDGSSHDGAIEYDNQRTAWLEDQGWRVVRFTNQDVLQRLESVLAEVDRFLKAGRD